MRSNVARLLVTAGFLVTPLAGGLACDRTISEKETVTRKRDGTVVTERKTVKERADGSVVVEREKDADR